jgi:hypothetical protein
VVPHFIFVTLNVIMLRVILLRVILLSVFMLSIIAPILREAEIYLRRGLVPGQEKKFYQIDA